MIGKLMHFLRAARLALLTLGLALLPSLSSAVYFPVALEHGKVFARTLVKGPSGYPIFVVYDERGEISQEIGEAVGELQDALIMSRGAYNTYAEELNRILQDRDGVGRGATVMTREAYENYEFLTVDDKPVTNKPSLRPDSTSVLVRSKERLLAPDQSPILLQAPFNLYNAVPLDASIRSLLVNKQGETVTTSTGNIGLKAELYRDPETRREPLGPIPYVFVEGSMIALGGTPGSMTDRQGRYSFSYLLPPCPGFTFEYTSPLFARLYYKNFNPRGQRFGTYHIQRTNYHFCNGIPDVAPGLTLGGLMAQIDAMAMRAAAAVPIYPINFPVDVYLITGNARLANCVPPEHPDSCSRWVVTGDGTRYEYQTPDTSPIIHLYDENGDGTPDEGYDFDGDDKPDLIVRGDLQRNPETGKETFVVNPEGTLQGVYLSAGGRSPTAELEESRQPDFTRALDRRADFEHKGLLSSITADDLKKTDLYVFRESNGQLVTERKGLKDEEVQTVFNDGGLDENGSGQMYYKVLIRGRGDAGNSMRGDFEGWQQRSKMEPEFYRRDSDHLRPGEKVRVILINRPTGYIGAVTTEIRGADLDFNQLISLRIPEIRLAPPNLSVHVKRRQTIEHGLTRDEEREYLIGFEGGASSTDSVIEVSTEWYDHDGRPLPEGLGEFGYTGRLAKVVGANELAPEGGELANFRIRPGRHQQVIRVRDSAITREHFYLHIAGDPPDRNPDFSTLGAGDGPLAARPAHYTPFKVAVFDEKTTIVARNAWRRAREEGDVTGRFPEPIYKWLYRPEMQFSLFDLSMQQILQGAEGEQSVSILQNQIPVVGIGSLGEFVRFSYSLLANDLNPLPLLGGDRDLVLAVGEQELVATLGADQQLRFSNLQHLAALSPEDFLTMRLYFNHDPENVLWEFAFSAISLFPERNRELSEPNNVIEVTTDEAGEGPLAISAFISGDTSRTEDIQRMYWRSAGTGSLDSPVTDSSVGIHGNYLTLTTNVNDSTSLFARLDENGPPVLSPTYKIVAGEPYSIEIEKSGKTAIGGVGRVDLNVTVKDRYGNNVKDGTKVSIEVASAKTEGVGLTVDGRVSLSIIGDDESGDQTVVIGAGRVRKQETIHIHDIELSFANVSDVALATEHTFELVATSSYGSLAGVAVDVAVHRGRLSDTSVVLNDQGKASVGYSSGEYPGFAQISAKVANTSRVSASQFFVRNSGDYLLSNVLVTDGSGSIALSGGTHQYSSSTQLVVHAAPGETITSSLANIFEPPVYALQDYSLATQSGSEITLLDVSSGIDATGHGAAIVPAGNSKFSIAWELAEGGDISIPEHARTTNLVQAGLNFWVQIPDLTTGANEILVDWDDFGLTLARTPDNRLRLLTQRQGTTYDVQSSAPLRAGTWHQVAMHFVGGKLRLGLDGSVVEVEVGSAIDPLRSQSHAIKINASTLLRIAGLKVFDWLGEAKIAFADGSFDTTATADENGVARLGLQARPNALTYRRLYHSPTQSFASRVGSFFISSAHADEAAEQRCIGSFAPVPEDAPDPLVSSAERFMNVILECFIRTRIEEARVEYRTADGWRSKVVALAKEGVYVGVYEVLSEQRRNALAIANCLDAAITGENASAVGALCDFVTGLLAIGDIRDLLIQGWHYYIGDRNKFDPLVASLAGVGLALDALQLVPGAQAGVVVNGLTTTAKQVAKILRLLGDPGKLAAKTLGNHIGYVARNKSLSAGQKIDAFKKMIPLMEIMATVALIYQSEPRIFTFLANTLTSAQTLDNMMSWMERYLLRLATELNVAEYQRVPAWVDFMFPAAHADVSGAVKQRFIRNVAELLDDAPKLRAGATSKEIADAFNQALDLFLKALRDNRFTLNDVPDDMLTVRAFMKLHEVAGEASVRRLAFNSGWTIGLNNLFGNPDMVRALAKLDAEALARGGVENGRQGVVRIASQLENPFQFAKGSMAHLLIISDLLRRSDVQLRGVEVTEPARRANATEALLPERRHDLIVESNGERINVEIKNFQENTWKDNLGKTMRNTLPDAGSEAANEVVAGQLMTDLVRYIQAGNKGQQWWFTPDVIPGARQVTAPLDPATIAAKEMEITAHIKKLVKDNEVQMADRYFGLKIAGDKANDADIEDWIDIRSQLFSALDGANGQQGFVKIYRFEQILPPPQ